MHQSESPLIYIRVLGPSRRLQQSIRFQEQDDAFQTESAESFGQSALSRLTVHNLRHALLRHIHRQVWPCWPLIHVVYAREALDLASPRLCVHSFSVSLLAVLKRRGNVDQEKVAAC